MKGILVLVAAASLLCAAEMKLGKALTQKKSVAIAALLDSPADYLNKTVLVKGKITEVCQMMGCWMNLADENGRMVRIKVEDGDIEFPKDSAGKTAMAEGKFTKTELTRDQAAARAK